MATILIVDDLAANRKVLVTLLRYEGHRLLEAADGRAGLAVVQAEHPDLVITDVLMPVMDGYEFVRHLRLDPATSRIPVVFCTAHYGEREARALALSSGVADVLTKPIDPEEVLTVAGRALSGESGTGGAPDAAPLTTAFDREHLRLVTDKLSEKAGDLKSANERLRALINIGLELASERDSERLLQSVCAAARDLFGATYVTLGILDQNDRTVERVVTSGVEAGHGIKVGDDVPGFLGTIIAERRTLRGENPGGDPSSLELSTRHPEIQAFLAAPIASPTHVYGWMCLASNEGTSFSEDDEHLVTALSGQVGRIYELKRFEQTLQDKNVELEAASRMKSEFVSNMSHELKTPLNAIIGFSAVLMDGLVGELSVQQGGFITDIFTSGTHLLSLVNDILDLSSIEAGKIVLDLEPVLISSLLANSLSIVKEKADAHHIRMAMDAPEALWSMNADARKVTQIVYNLLSNALKFNTDGGQVILRAGRVPRADVGQLSGSWIGGRSLPFADNEFTEFLKVSVTDSGIGISPEGLRLLFRPFSQIDSGLARKFEGVGLGLTMVKRLVELHGGTVAVESAVGEGSCFTFWLPLRAPEEVPLGLAHASPSLVSRP